MFAVINGLRRWFRVAYTPSYFVLFPVSLLDPDVARFASTGPFDPPNTESEKHTLKRAFLAKITIAGLVTFAIIPLFLGLTAAFYMAPAELGLTLGILLSWQAYASYQSILDNSWHASKPIGSRSLFGVFYLFYLASLGGFIQEGYKFARPFVQRGDYTGMFASMWSIIFLLLIAGLIVGVLGNLLAYFITERDVL